MSVPGAGVLLALSGDDADILRVLSQAGSGLCVVRRCADLPELLSAGMAGLATFALLDTGFDEIDRTVLDRLARAGLSGLLLVDDCEEERWRSAGWPVLRRDTDPSRICSVMQDLVRRGAPSGGSSQGTGPVSAAVSETVTGPVAADTDCFDGLEGRCPGDRLARRAVAPVARLPRRRNGAVAAVLVLRWCWDR